MAVCIPSGCPIVWCSAFASPAVFRYRYLAEVVDVVIGVGRGSREGDQQTDQRDED
ncbi:MAG: hypothetical protein OXE46_10915 [Chloroflexi bacterium]|nr:hypothetical protein [Chloroflexota bacterium]